MIHQTLAEWSQWFWPLAANHLWQATLFALVAWIAAAWLNRPRMRHIVWLLAFAKFLLPSALMFLLAQKLGLNFSWSAQTEMIGAAEAGVWLQISEPVTQMAQLNAGAGHDEAYCVLTILWLTGVVLCFARWRMRRRRFAQALRGSEKLESGREVETLEDLKSRLKINRQINLIRSSQMVEPGVWGVARPVIVLPQGLAGQLDDGELESALAHELFHIKRHDNLLASWQMIARCLFWFHPLVWLIDRKLIEERELMCDEQVISSGAAPDAYAAGLWKIAQFGLGWPAPGVSRAAGSNFKRRIKLMLNANYQSKTSRTSRALAGLTLCALVGLAVAMAAFSRDGAQVAKAQNDQERKFVLTAPMGIENLPEIPLVITEARLSVSEAREMTASGVNPQGEKVQLTIKGGRVRDVEFVVTMVNQGQRRVTEISVEIVNAALWPEERFIITSKPMTAAEAAAGAPGVIDPQGSFTLKAGTRFDEKKDGLEMINHLSDFKVRAIGVRFDSEKEWLWAELEKTLSASKPTVRMMKLYPELARKPSREQQVSDKERSDPEAANPIRQMDSSTRPTILHREIAKYTLEARDNGVEGIVQLSVVFGADGQIGDLRVLRGLPHGLTEEALEAAKRIRFEPATKDGQPVSVRGTVEYSFRLGQ